MRIERAIHDRFGVVHVRERILLWSLRVAIQSLDQRIVRGCGRQCGALRSRFTRHEHRYEQNGEDERVGGAAGRDE